MEVYLDNSATTQVFPEVAEAMTQIMCLKYGNPSSMHLKGMEAENQIRKAKETLAGILKCTEKEILFTIWRSAALRLPIRGAANILSRR